MGGIMRDIKTMNRQLTQQKKLDFDSKKR
jgi:hypothetical protein